MLLDSVLPIITLYNPTTYTKTPNPHPVSIPTPVSDTDYMLSHPPLLISPSSLRAIKLCIPPSSQTFLSNASYLR
jgi:hypothetical protein